MRIIQTSDLHLSSKKPERLKALENIIFQAKERKADLVLVSGDLFDSNEQAGQLRPALRNMMPSLPFTILAIPGNHDMEAYRSDLNFGNSIKILVKQPFETIEYQDLKLFAVPYANQNFNDLVPELKKEIDKSRLNILMIHCTLDIPYLGEDEYGQEERQAYLPVNSKVLGDLGFDYVLAGHFHSRTVESPISDKTVFMYSGSPVSITRKEQGKRRAVFLDTGTARSKRLSFIEIDSFYYDHIEMYFHPGKEDAVIKELKSKLDSFKGRDVSLSIDLGGFISTGEKSLGDNIKQIIKSRGPGSGSLDIKENYRDIKTVLEDPLYRAFKEKLKDRELGQDLKEKIDEMVIMQFSRLKF